MRKALLLMALSVVFVPLVLIASSCQPESNTILIRIGEFYFEPETIRLRAGQHVKIDLINEGKIEHEFMVGRVLKTEESKAEAHEVMHEADEEKHETSEVGHEHHEGMHSAHAGMSRGFEKDFFDGIDVVVKTEKGSEFMKVTGHGTMVTLEPEGKAAITFKVPVDRKGEWQMACFVPGHYEADMKGLIIIN